MLGKMFKSLFSSSGDGTKSASKATTVDYEGFQIVPEPQQNNGQWQVSGRIEKRDGETTRSHTFIRADTLPEESAAANEMIRKAKMMIDQMGESLFD